MKIAVIGCGAMGSAFAKHFAKQNSVLLFDKNQKKSASLAAEIGAASIEQMSGAIEKADVILLAVKPKDLSSVSKIASPLLTKEKLVVSILAGASTRVLEGHFPSATVVRTMPNLALTCGKGVIGLVDKEGLSPEVKSKIDRLLEGIGLSVWLSESKVDALTAVTGSGIAFIFLLIEAMVEGGVFIGLSANEALEFVLSAFEGAVALLRQTGKDPAELRAQVSSPGGTTIAGLHVMEQKGVRGAIMDTLIACHLKGLQIGKETV